MPAQTGGRMDKVLIGRGRMPLGAILAAMASRDAKYVDIQAEAYKQGYTNLDAQDIKMAVARHLEQRERIAEGHSPSRKARHDANTGAASSRLSRRRAKNRTAKASRKRNR